VNPVSHVFVPLAALATAWLSACGSAPAPTAGPPPAPVVIATPRLTADDLAVATVNGHTVWGSCVTAQAQGLAAGTPDERRRAALDQCIAFELLAPAGEARGLAAAPEVAVAVRTAAVSRLVETDFEQHYRGPDDLKAQSDAIMARNEWRLHVPQMRASAFARFTVPKEAGPDVDARAHALADKLAAELAGQTGLYGSHLSEAAARVAAGSDIKLDGSDVKPSRPDDLVKPYADALFGLAAVGQASRAVRTDWGWDVIVWTGGIAAKERSRDEVVGEMFPELRRRQFQIWAGQIAKQLGIHVEVDQAEVAKLDTAGEP